MARSGLYTFRAVTIDDLALLKQWQSRPHVAQWWDDEDWLDEEDLKDDRVARWIVGQQGKQIAYMQDYTVHGWDNHPFFHLPKGSRGIDQFIGEPDMIGQGHGTAFINERMHALFDAGAPAIATDPHPENKRAIAAYQKAGFEREGPPKQTQWGLILPMVAFSDASA